jgi:hypothetical protein
MVDRLRTSTPQQDATQRMPVGRPAPSGVLGVRSLHGAPGPAALIQLQRLAGNRTATALLGSTPHSLLQRAKAKTKTTPSSSGLKGVTKTAGNKKASARAMGAILSGRKGARPDTTKSGELQSRGGTPLYGSSEFLPVDPTNDYGTGMSVQIIDWNHTPNGSPPSVKPSWWPKGDAWWTAYMVQGHLLNENLGGPGNDMRNLAPISKTANSEHLHQVETLAKDAVIANGGSADYSVEVVAGPPAPGAFSPYEDDNSQPNRHLITRLPQGFECTLLDDDGNLLVAWTVVNRF